jgi:hypothetical protein
MTPRRLPHPEPLPGGNTKCFHECIWPQHPAESEYSHILKPGEQCFHLRYRKCESCIEAEKLQHALPFGAS